MRLLVRQPLLSAAPLVPPLPVRRALVLPQVAVSLPVAPPLVVRLPDALHRLVPHLLVLPVAALLVAALLVAALRVAVQLDAAARPTTDPFTGCAPAA